MKNKILIILLLFSVAINIVLFVKGEKTEKEKKPVVSKLVVRGIKDLKDYQRKELKEIIKNFRIEISDYKDRILAKRIDIIDTLSNPDFKIDDLENITRELNKSENELNLFFVDTLGRIGKIMNNEQRIKLLLKFSKYWFYFKNK